MLDDMREEMIWNDNFKKNTNDLIKIKKGKQYNIYIWEGLGVIYCLDNNFMLISSLIYDKKNVMNKWEGNTTVKRRMRW